MGGKRGVEEESDRLFDAGAAQRLGHHHEVIVVDPDDVAGLEQRHQGGGKTGIDPLVGVEILARKHREIEAVMEQRPQGAVGEAIVIVGIFLLAQIEGGVGDLAGGDHLRGLGGGGGDFAAPAQPNAAAFLESRQQRHRESSRARTPLLDRRHAIGNHDQTIHKVSPDGLLRGNRRAAQSYHGSGPRLTFMDVSPFYGCVTLLWK